MSYLFTSESVSEGHPDKIADRISDELLDNFLAFDDNARVACETMVTTGQVILSGEVTTKSFVDVQSVVRNTINDIGYTKSEYMFDGNSCGIMSHIHEQSPDINMGVDKAKKEEQGAGDQGIMFGYAVNETPTYIPATLYLSHKILEVLASIRKEGKIMTYLRPDAKSQVTIEYGEDNKPIRIDTIVVSTQHDEYGSYDIKLTSDIIRDDILKYVIPRVKDEINDERINKLFEGNIKYLVNPTGAFVIGGPHGDTGLTGRKIIVDTYGGRGAHGGGAFSGKDPSKVDRSAAYAARHIAKNMVASGVADEMLVQLSYAIGVKEPVSIYVNTYGTSHVNMSDGEIAKKIGEIFTLTPYEIGERLGLRKPIYAETSAYGHMGRTPRVVSKKFKTQEDKNTTIFKRIVVELFTWEKLDYVDKIREKFNLC